MSNKQNKQESNELTLNQNLIWKTIKEKATGRSNAITVPDLSFMTNITERKVREIVSELRKKQYPISSTVHSPYGYFVPANWDEAEETINQMNHRIQEIEEAISGYRKGLNQLFC